MALIGWIGSILLAICGAPEAYQAIINVGCQLTWSFLFMWGVGELFTLMFVMSQRNCKLLPLMMNYGLNLIFIMIMVIMKVQ